jgi:lipopolysaccharide transport system ATP-binding protein
MDKDIIIDVRDISKRYRIGVNHISDTFFDQIKSTLTSPLKNFKRISGLSNFKNDEDTIFWALKHINFKVQKGEVLGIIGHNGAGKSTLLKVLSRITAPSSGSIEIKGRVASLLEVGTGFHPELTGRDNIYMNGTILGMTKKEIDSKLDQIIEFSGVSKHLDTAVKFYSSGMKVRLAFSVAAHLDPEVLIIDEVLAVGDAEFQSKCLGRMSDIANEGRTILFVSHDMAAVQKLCTRVCTMSGGSIIYDGNPADAVYEYLFLKKDVHKAMLGSRIDRVGGDTFKFENIQLLTSENKETSLVLSGQTLKFRLFYKDKAKSEKSFFDLHITVYSYDDRFMFTCSTQASGYLITMEEEGIIDCTIEKFPLTPGEYKVNLYATKNGEIVDWIKDTTRITVIEGDFYNSGKIFSHKYGFLPEQKWEGVEKN